MSLIEIYNCKSGRILELHQDESADDPRTWDNRGKMVCFHSRYTLGDDKKNFHFSNDDFENWEHMENHIFANENAVICIPLTLYDHGGITMKMGTHNSFDSGQVGFIYITQETVNEEGISMGNGDGLFDDESITDFHNRLESYLKGEVETYAQYLEGDVYGFKLIERTEHNDDDKDVEIDACWGFYGSDIKENGMLDHLSPEDHPIDL